MIIFINDRNYVRVIFFYKLINFNFFIIISFLGLFVVAGTNQFKLHHFLN